MIAAALIASDFKTPRALHVGCIDQSYHSNTDYAISGNLISDLSAIDRKRKYWVTVLFVPSLNVTSGFEVFTTSYLTGHKNTKARLYKRVNIGFCAN